MAWFDGLKKFFQRKESAVSGVIVRQFSPGQPIWSGHDLEKLAREGYQTSVYVYAAVGKVAQACAGIPWKLYATKANGDDDEELKSHPLLSLLDKPNPMMGAGQFKENVIAFRLLSGESYIERVGPNDQRKPPKELYSLRPDRTRPLVGTPTEPFAGVEYQAAGGIQKIPASHVLFWKTFNPLDDFRGLPPLVAAARSVDQNNSAQAFNVSLMQNQARPSGLLILESDQVTQADVDDFRAELETNWKGTNNVGRPAVLTKGIKWQQTSLTPEEVSWMEGQKLSASQIAIAFGVPPQLLGIEGSLTFANYAEARKAFYLETVLPLMDQLVDELNRWLVPMFGGNLRIAYDVDNIEALNEDRGKVWERTTKAWIAGVLQLDDAREALGFDPDPTNGKKYHWEVRQAPAQLTAPADPKKPPVADVTGQQNESHQRDAATPPAAGGEE